MEDRGGFTTWREKLEKYDDEIVHYAPDEAAFDVEFYGDFGGAKGPHVLAWSNNYVYFPVTYDGYESIGRAPRNPTDEGQQHVGGE